MTRSRALLIVSIALTVSLLSLMAVIHRTDAGFVSAEQSRVSATAGTVSVPLTTCTPNSGSPNVLTMEAASDGLTVTGYRVTMALTADLPSGWTWQSGTNDGVELAPLGDSTWPSTQAKLKFGIELPTLAGGDALGTATIRAIGPGGWESEPTVYDWEIYADWGFSTVTCDLQSS